jgi:hypothetical protein
MTSAYAVCLTLNVPMVAPAAYCMALANSFVHSYWRPDPTVRSQCFPVQTFKFERMGCFAFSEEDGTPAATYPGQVPVKLRQRRRDELISLQQRIGEEFAASLVGKEVGAFKGCGVASTQPLHIGFLGDICLAALSTGSCTVQSCCFVLLISSFCCILRWMCWWIGTQMTGGWWVQMVVSVLGSVCFCALQPHPAVYVRLNECSHIRYLTGCATLQHLCLHCVLCRWDAHNGMHQVRLYDTCSLLLACLLAQSQLPACISD